MHYGWLDFWILITKISILISIILLEHCLNSDLVNWFFYTLFVEFPPLSDIQLCVTAKSVTTQTVCM